MPGPSQIQHSITLTSDGELAWDADDNLIAVSFQVEGDFGGGTVFVLVSNDNVKFYPLPNEGNRAFSTPGVKSILLEDTAFLYFKCSLQGSTNPNLTIWAVERKN